MIRLAAALLVIAYFLRRKPTDEIEDLKDRLELYQTMAGTIEAHLRSHGCGHIDDGAFNSPSWSSDALQTVTYAGGQW